LNIPADVRLIPIRLTLNMRNTLRIHEVLKRYYEGHPIEPLGPVGLMVEWIKCKTVQALIHQTEKCVNRLFINERINLEDITILMSDNTLLEATNWTHNITGYPTTNCSELKKNSVVIDTVRRFKGLESKIVILVLTKDMISKTELLYVATSRARNHLIILGLDKIVEKISPPNSCDA
jgi:DNA helicase IV